MRVAVRSEMFAIAVEHRIRLAYVQTSRFQNHLLMLRGLRFSHKSKQASVRKLLQGADMNAPLWRCVRHQDDPLIDARVQPDASNDAVVLNALIRCSDPHSENGCHQLGAVHEPQHHRRAYVDVHAPIVAQVGRGYDIPACAVRQATLPFMLNTIVRRVGMWYFPCHYAV